MRSWSEKRAWPKNTRESTRPHAAPERQHRGESQQRQQDHVGAGLGREGEPLQQQQQREERRGESHGPLGMGAWRRERPLRRDRVGPVVHPQRRAPDADSRLAGKRQPRDPLRAVLRVHPVHGSQVLGDELPVLAAIDAQVVRGHVGVVHHDVVVEGPAHPRLGGVDALARRDLAVAREHLDPHHRAQRIASRKRRPRATALAWDTPCIESCASSASRLRSWVRASSVTLYRPSNSR